MDQIFALVATIPLLVAAALLAAQPVLKDKEQVRDWVAVAASASVAVMLAVLALRTSAGSVYWFAGFRPAGGVAVGIDFEADPLNAGLACVGAVLMTAAMIFAWRYFPQVGMQARMSSTAAAGIRAAAIRITTMPPITARTVVEVMQYSRDWGTGRSAGAAISSEAAALRRFWFGALPGVTS
jgi:formate hydrogenlyase subunit 3/multisubunit Na+/H+ antiporter MnhD subunit